MALLVLALFFLLLLILVVGAGLTLFDLFGRREDQAEWLQAKLGERLARHPALGRLPLLPVVQVPVSPRAPVTVELFGVVPTEELRAAAEDVVMREATGRLRVPARLESRVAVAPPTASRAA